MLHPRVIVIPANRLQEGIQEWMNAQRKLDESFRIVLMSQSNVGTSDYIAITFLYEAGVALPSNEKVKHERGS